MNLGDFIGVNRLSSKKKKKEKHSQGPCAWNGLTGWIYVCPSTNKNQKCSWPWVGEAFSLSSCCVLVCLCLFQCLAKLSSCQGWGRARSAPVSASQGAGTISVPPYRLLLPFLTTCAWETLGPTWQGEGLPSLSPPSALGRLRAVGCAEFLGKTSWSSLVEQLRKG